MTNLERSASPPPSPAPGSPTASPAAKRARPAADVKAPSKPLPLDEFLETARKRIPARDGPYKTRADLRPAKIIEICQNALASVGAKVSLQSSKVYFEHPESPEETDRPEGSRAQRDRLKRSTAQQTIRFQVVPKPSTASSASGSGSNPALQPTSGPFLVDLEIKKCLGLDQAKQELKDRMASFQVPWGEVFRPSSGAARVLGHYALETDDSILWAEWGTSTVLRIVQVPASPQPGETADADAADKFAKIAESRLEIIRRLAFMLNQAYVGSAMQAGEDGTDRTGNIEFTWKPEKPVLTAGKSFKLKFDFPDKAHQTKDIVLGEGGLVTIGADIDSKGELVLVGLEPGQTELQISAVHAEYLDVTTKVIRLQILKDDSSDA